jgi:sugar/nucleoside kinase (ribokinase family)
MRDVITIGSATRDIFIRSSVLEVRDNDRSPGGVDACFPLGAKIEIKELVLETGGGGTNAATTFGRLGWRVAALSAVGKDDNGRDVLTSLRKEKIDTSLVQIDPREQTALSIIALAGTGERTVLVYRGASENIRPDKIKWSALKAKWFYITSLGGRIELLQKVLGHAAKNGIRVAWNPGSMELRNGLEKLAMFIRQVDIFNLNLEEAIQLTGLATRDIKKLFGAMHGLPRRAAIITDGTNGAYAYADDGRRTWHSRVLDVKRVNATGAGDAFGSGLVAGLMKKDDLPYALAVATVNAAGVVQKMGAKRGILRKYPSPQQIKKVPISLW